MDAKYLVGIQEIDAQHADVFAAIESLQRSIAADAAPQALVPALRKLQDLLLAHFDYEESFMGSIECVDRGEHEARHLELRALLDECVNSTAPAAADGSPAQVLGRKISDHLLEYDAKLGYAVEHLVTNLRRHEAAEKF